MSPHQYDGGSVRRVINIEKFNNRWLRFLGYLYFNFVTFISLLVQRPQVILYYETYSSFPPYLLHRFFGVKSRIFAHYHEYISPAQYKTEMKLFRVFHQKEPYIYERAEWISQTNVDRLDLFQKDHASLDFGNKLQTMPNFPPQNWIHIAKQQQQGPAKKMPIKAPLKLVYVGSLSTTHMYSIELFRWIKAQKGKITLDIYSINLKPDIRDFLKELDCPFIRMMGGIQYDHIPFELSKYDVGLVIYKGHSPNYIYNAPNKLFEYLACGLDVWFSSDLVSSKPYVREDCYPKIVEVDFQDLMNFDWYKAIDRSGLTEVPTPYYCEQVYKALADRITHEVPHT